eukprot:TRINITY_DN181_c0_g1_i2.p1 TRINITY_DN181_c0_g1~~TRINITY_DN181_c0_g1_i2.p1  ORF type:complete len:1509 (+),score=270.51 TRINITY_DN181_c0_g1_i2:57-4583(+)
MAQFQPTEYATGQRLWLPSEEHGYVLVTVLDANAQFVRVQLQGRRVVIVERHPRGLSIREEEARVATPFENKRLLTQIREISNPPDNLVDATELHEAAILECIRQRFMNGQIYTRVGSIVVAVNPWERHPENYDEAKHQDIRLNFSPSMTPHIFCVAELAFRNVSSEALGRRSQAIIVSGESGAGKTESCKYILQHIGRCAGNGQMSSMSDSIEKANVILEAFGNAKTRLNDNSSRFGKFTKIRFNDAHQIAGVEIETYLLEKPRVTSRCVGDRSFHIFYQLSHAPEEVLKSLSLCGAESYEFLTHSEVLDIDGVDETVMFAETVEAMSKIGITERDQTSIWKILAAILHLGNVRFKSDRSNFSVLENQPGSAGLTSEEEIDIAATLLEVRSESLRDALTKSYITVSGGRNEIRLNVTEATGSRNALCRFLYASIFDWLVARIKVKLLPPRSSVIPAYVGLLDIFGFETFEHNSLEQFFINYTNETIQRIFNHHIFNQLRDEYNQEGLVWNDVEYTDNRNILDLIEHTKTGIITLLNDTNIMRNTDTANSDSAFINKVERQHGSNPIFRRTTNSTNFSIEHFAGKVTYNALGFTEKNNDTMQTTIRDCIQGSGMNFLKSLLGSSTGLLSQDRDRSRQYAPSIATRFLEQIGRLKAELATCESHFVRCMKPNIEKIPKHFSGKEILRQLKYSGVIEAIRIMRQFYSVRETPLNFVTNYLGPDAHSWKVCLRRIYGYTPSVRCDFRHASTIPLDSLKTVSSELCQLFNLQSPKDYQIGKAKIFLTSDAQTKIQKILEDFKRNCEKTISTLMSSFLSREVQLSLSILQRATRTQSQLDYVAQKEKKMIQEESLPTLNIWTFLRFQQYTKRAYRRCLERIAAAKKIQKWYRSYRRRELILALMDGVRKVCNTVTMPRAEFNRMKQDLELLNDDNIRWRTTSDRKDQQIQESRDESSALRGALHAAQNENTELRNRIQLLELERRHREQGAGEFQRTYQAILAQKDAEILALNDKVSQLASELDLQKSYTRELQAQVDELGISEVKKSQMIDVFQDQIAQLEHEKKSHHEQIYALQKKLEEAQVEIENLMPLGGQLPAMQRAGNSTPTVSFSAPSVRQLIPLPSTRNLFPDQIHHLTASLTHQYGYKLQGNIYHRDSSKLSLGWGDLKYFELSGSSIILYSSQRERKGRKEFNLEGADFSIGLQGTFPDGCRTEGSFCLRSDHFLVKFVCPRVDVANSLKEALRINIALNTYVSNTIRMGRQADPRILKFIGAVDIEDLDFCGYDLQQEAIELLSSVIMDHDLVKLVNLNNTGVKESLLQNITTGVLNKIASLSILNLGNNSFGDNGLAEFVRLYKPRNCNLESLCLAGNKLCNANDLATLIAQHEQLVDIDLSNNDLSPVAIEQLCEAIKSRRVKHLRISCSRIDVNAMQSIARLIASNQYIRNLHLERCRIDDDVCNILIAALETPNGVVQINLANNPISQETVRRLLSITWRSGSLKVVRFAGDEIIPME